MMSPRARAVASILSATVALVSVAASGCGYVDECTNGDSDCQGSRVRRCRGPSGDTVPGSGKGAYWHDERDCAERGLFCAVHKGGAGCFASAERVPECAGDATTACRNNQRVQCWDGFVREVDEDCATFTCTQPCPATTICVATVSTPVADARCRADDVTGTDGHCSGRAALNCGCGGKLLSEVECASAETCLADFSFATCAFSAAIDPRCPNELGPEYYCDGTTAVRCRRRHAIERLDCSDSSCATYGCTNHTPKSVQRP